MRLVDVIFAEIQTLTYRIGFSPSPTSIFFSPALHLSKAYGDAMSDMVFFTPLTTVTIPELEVEKEDPRQTIYHRMTYCPICGAKLEPVVLDVKDCPCGHGKAYTSENDLGLPVVTFEPSDNERSVCDQ